MTERAGRPAEIELEIGGMACAACVGRVERALRRVEGVASADVSFATGRATVVCAAGTACDALIQALEEAGYAAKPLAAASGASRDGGFREFLVAAGLTVPIVAVSMAVHMRPGWANWLLFALASPVVFWAGRGFHQRAFQGLRHGSATMDTLVSLGSLSAWGLSVFGLLAFPAGSHAQADHVYFEVAATILTLVLFGRALEARARARMSGAVERLVGLVPPEVLVLGPDGTESPAPVARVRPGDLIRLRPGERVAVDGAVVEGTSAIDESPLTGEPTPVERGPGDAVSAGTLNTSGSLVYRAERVGQETELARIVRLVRRAQGSKAPAQRLANRVAGVFVPVVVAVAGLTLVGSVSIGVAPDAALLRSVAVLVVACPCALGLATPTALVVGVARGAELGVLVKDGATLESACAVRTALLDKTGTITLGRPTVTDVVAFGVEEDLALRLAASLEAPSEHPLARAVLTEASRRGLALWPVERFEARRGAGVRGAVAGRELEVTAEFNEGTPAVERWRGEGKTVFALREGTRALAVIAAEDTLGPGAVEGVAALRRLGVEPVMVTGDHEGAARAVARRVGIDRIHARVRPEEKAALVERYRVEGRVAMVGDGVNDAPALATADLGVAMGHGTGVALDTAGIALLRSDLRGVATAIALSRATLGIVRGNLFWAFAYNVCMVPLAMVGLVNPMLAAGAMALSSVSVVANSLRLRKFRPPWETGGRDGWRERVGVEPTRRPETSRRF